MARLILDTTALIDLERDRIALESNDSIAIAAVTLAELRLGVHLANTPARKEARQRFVDEISERIDVLPYTRETAAEHAVLLHHVRATGKPRGADDLIIAAHARQSGRHVVSSDNKARFGELPGVQVA